MAGVTLAHILQNVNKEYRQKLSQEKAQNKVVSQTSAVPLKVRSLQYGTRAAMNAGRVVMDAAPISTRYKVGKQWLKPGDYGAYKGKEKTISSTAIQNMKYNPNNRVLELLFVGGKHSYAYPSVPSKVIENFEKAFSKGRFFNKNIKEQYSVPSFRGHA
ncbi:KTSC domain protein [uncultured archaeon]|nr:KTSC domain protein [uncultured archaeon]